ncbi:hypothetical protein [Aureibacter tunicatorum]|uniref:Uncharacterized protein n=1 Tax=Aureibacter tunicatorum TaxID=866807 RepID=A0AAE4BQH9_9BACT|nr:hypothetical protein [Aureibacter tunicatorum]MDR6239139.1 hypothetical protein [Aureibacter tunicatorum]BDD04935.1 hypothetical protein AUTU_24180 [Aureibacter tunicatorum]
MIHSKPKFNTLSALAVFNTLMLMGFIYSLKSLLAQPSNILLLVTTSILFVIFLFVLIKTALATKQVIIANLIIEEKYLWGVFSQKHQLEHLNSWCETIIKTKNGVFKSLELDFTTRKKIKLSNHEDSKYAEILKYLSKKYPKKKASTNAKA